LLVKRVRASAIVLAALGLSVAGAMLMGIGYKGDVANDAEPGAKPAAVVSSVTTPVSAAQDAGAQEKTPSSVQDSGLIAVRIDEASGHATLRVNEQWLDRHGRAMLAQVRVTCRYAPARQQWQRLPASPTRIAYRVEPREKDGVQKEGAERLFYELPREAGLYWVYWIEEPAEGGAKRVVTERRETFSTGRIKCDGANAAVVEAGRIEACVPLADRAERQVVADPALACAELR